MNEPIDESSHKKHPVFHELRFHETPIPPTRFTLFHSTAPRQQISLTMKNAFALLCLAAFALATEGRQLETIEGDIGGHDRDDIGVLHQRRDLKGSSKGKGGKGSSKGSSDACEQLWVYFNEKDFKDSFEGDGLIGTNQVKLFFQGGKRAGSYIEVTTGVGPKDCYSNGVYTLETDNNGRPTTQVFVSSTCYAKTQAITGGTGDYACATGTVALTNKGAKTRDNRMISLCNAGCFS